MKPQNDQEKLWQQWTCFLRINKQNFTKISLMFQLHHRATHAFHIKKETLFQINTYSVFNIFVDFIAGGLLNTKCKRSIVGETKMQRKVDMKNASSSFSRSMS